MNGPDKSLKEFENLDPRERNLASPVSAEDLESPAAQEKTGAIDAEETPNVTEEHGIPAPAGNEPIATSSSPYPKRHSFRVKDIFKFGTHKVN